MVTKRRRGRPAGSPTGAKTENFSTRITRDLRQQLEQRAAEKGISLSEQVGNLLRLSLDFDNRQERLEKEFGGKETLALMWLLSFYVRQVEFWTGQKWTDDLYTHQQIRAGIALLLDAIAPKEKSATPPARRLRFLATQYELHAAVLLTMAANVTAPEFYEPTLEREQRTIGVPELFDGSVSQTMKETLGKVAQRLEQIEIPRRSMSEANGDEK